jgi:hypothetical protein
MRRAQPDLEISRRLPAGIRHPVGPWPRRRSWPPSSPWRPTCHNPEHHSNVPAEREKDLLPFSFVNCLRVVGCSPLSPIAYCGHVDAEEIRSRIRHGVKRWLEATLTRYPEWVREAVARDPELVELQLARNPQ